VSLRTPAIPGLPVRGELGSNATALAVCITAHEGSGSPRGTNAVVRKLTCTSQDAQEATRNDAGKNVFGAFRRFPKETMT